VGKACSRDVGESDVLHDLAEVFTHRDPDAGEVVRGARIRGIFRPLSADRGQRSFHRPDDVRDGDLRGVARQQVANLGPFL
jgi:hypothetical protein